MNFGSLFAGIGGFDLGFERAGMVCRWQAELDKQVSAVLAHRWPEVRKYRHVESINYRTGKAYRRYHKPESVDLICGGFPCQDVSVAGKRAGLAGERSGLWFEFHRILSQSRPEWVVVENVPGLLSSNRGRDFAVILRGLVELGYGVAWRILDAQYFGVPQRRRRVFIVGHLGDGRAAEVLFERESGLGDSAPRREAGTRVAGTIGASVDRSSSPDGGGLRQNLDSMTYVASAFNGYTGGPDDNDAQGRHLVPALARSLTSRQARLDSDSDNFVTHPLKAEGADASEDGTGRGVPLTFQPRYYTRDNKTGGALSETVEISNTAKAGDSAPMVFQQNQRNEVRDLGNVAGAIQSQPGMKQQNYLAFESRYARNGRGAPDTIVPPLKAQSGQSGKGDGAPLVLAQNGSDVQTGDIPGALGAEHRGTNVDLVTAFAWQQGVSHNDRSYPVRKGEYAGSISETRVDAVSGSFGVRRLMPVECERLQGFPDNFTDVPGTSDSSRYRQLGNAVNVAVAEWLGRRIVKVAT